MDNKQKDKRDKIDKTSSPQNIDLIGYEFTYRSEPTFVVPLIDFVSGLAPLQSPIAKKEKLEKYSNKNRFVREFLSHELVDAFSFKAANLSKKFIELGGVLGFKDNISRSVLKDAGIKLNGFYWRVYVIYALTCLFFFLGFMFWFFIVPSVPPYVPPIVSPTILPTATNNLPTVTPSIMPTGVPSSMPSTTSPKVPPLKGVDIWGLASLSILSAPISIFLGLVFIFIVIRLGILVAGRRYASTLCLLACLYIVFELEQEDILSIDRIKNRLLNRIDFLSRYIPLVGLNLSHSDPSVREWALQYFRTMQKYVRQLERWVIAPKSDTLHILRKDFYTMAGILLYGNYAEIDWSTAASNIQDKPQTAGQRIASTLQGFISVGIPILLLLVVILRPEIIPPVLGTDKISLIAIAWFLIAVDVNLRLGVIDRILDIAKAIKELK